MKKNLLLFLFYFCGTSCCFWAQEASNMQQLAAIKKMNWGKMQSRTCLFLNNSQLAIIKKQNDTVTQQLTTYLKAELERLLKEEPLIYPNHANTMDTARKMQGQLINLALGYRLFGDVRYLERAKNEVLRAAALDNWGTSHFLDVGELCLGVGVAFNWLYDNFNLEEKKQVAQALANKALNPALETKEGQTHNTSWVNGNFNWNPVCHAGLLVAALAVAHEEPVLAKKTVERAIINLPFAGEAYKSDGSFPEAPSYWSYGTTFYVLAIEALQSVFGSACGLERIPGFLKSADYILQITGPTGQDFNYSDYHNDRWNEPVMLWYGKQLNRSNLVKNELNTLSGIVEKLKKGNITPSHRLTALELMWWKPQLLLQKPQPLPLQYSAHGGLPLAVMRTAWKDTLAGFLAIKGGTPNGSHGQMDVGSFVYEANGVRWAVDLGTEDYNKMRAAKLSLWDYSQKSSRWTTFRCGSAGHNLIRFNNQEQQVLGWGSLLASFTKKGVQQATFDLSSMYALQVKKCQRTVALQANKTLIVTDRWQTKATAATTTFQWLTRAKVTQTAAGLVLEEDGKFLKIDFFVLGNDTTKPVVSVFDVSRSVHIQDSENVGLSQIVIQTTTSKEAAGGLRVRASLD